MPAHRLLHLTAALLLASSRPAAATPLLTDFASCLDPTGSLVAPDDQLLKFTTLWTQFDTGQDAPGAQGPGTQVGTGQKDFLRATLVGTTGTQSEGYSSQTNFLATLINQASVLNFQTFFNQSALCSSMRTPTFNGTGGTLGNGTSSNASSVTNSGCPYGPGAVALGVTVPLAHAYPLTTISTQIRVLDTSTPALTLACVGIDTTPYYPSSWFYRLMLWIPVAVALGYLAVSWLGRIWASKISEQLDREAAVASSLTNRISDGRLLDRLGVIWWHTWSGQGLLLSGSLLRFATPSARDILWHTQFVASLGMVAVNWPGFAYPVFGQGAWSTLIYNVTLLASENSSRPDPLNPPPFNPPADFAGQIADQRSPLYLDQALPNVLLNLGGQASGMQRWAALTGVPAQDLFANCLIVFLAICGGIVALGFVFFVCDFLASFGRTPLSKHLSSVVDTADEEDGLGYPRSNGPIAGGQALGPGAAQAPWWQIGRRLTLKSGEKRGGASEKSGLHSARMHGERVRPSVRQHVALLQGNLTRVLTLFYYPIIIFSVYQLSLGSVASTASIALAALSLVILGLALPVLQLYRIRRRTVPRTRSGELVDDLPTILALGPLYNTFAERNELFFGLRFTSALVSGIVIGAAQSHGLAQAIVILCVELAETSMTSLWLPWGDGAAMGPLAFVLSVTRIITAVLLIVLSPTVGVGLTAAGWLTYVILILQGVVFTLAILILVVKIIELLFRVLAHVPFEETRSSRSGGLRGAIKRWDRGGGRSSRHSRAANIAARRRRGSKAPSSILANGRPRSRASTSVMLDVKDNHSNPALGRASSMGSRHDLYQQPALPFTDDDGYIMSAMSKGPWLRASGTQQDFAGDGFVAPGQYAARPPNHRQSLSWQDQVKAITPPSSGFSVVRGGRATEAAPWQMGGQDGRNGEREYPPFAHQASSSSGGSVGRTRAQSLSAAAELADAPRTDEWAVPGGAGDRLAQSRSATGHVGWSAAGAGAAAAVGSRSKAKKGGLLGRFGKGKGGRSEVSSDEEDEEESPIDEDVGTKRRWGISRLGRRGKTDGDGSASPMAGKSFEVVRQPRPRPSPRSTAKHAEPDPTLGAGPSTPAHQDRTISAVEPEAETEELREDPFAAGFGHDRRASVAGSIPPGAAAPILPGPSDGERDLASRRGSASDNEYFDAVGR